MLAPRQSNQATSWPKTAPEDPAVDIVRLPNEAELRDLLRLRSKLSIDGLFKEVLLDPIRDIADRPGKKIRGKLVDLGYELASTGDSSKHRSCRLASEVVELIHAGSLVVDDIEDGSAVRRGQPALHRRYGLPIALNAGNWLYFWPLEILRSMGLPEEKELTVYRYYHRTLLRAHFGQALDVGARVDSIEQARVPDTCLATMELKTGALTAFALVLGGILGSASAALVSSLDDFGHGFGVTLQMFDDLGNLTSRKDGSKRFEDLKLRRPSWVWGCAAQCYSRKGYAEFVSAVQRLPETAPLEDWLEKNNFVATAREQILAYLDGVHGRFAMSAAHACFHRDVLDKLWQLERTVAEAYD
jgi:geranylgeranyl pyrophosphate synthase